MLELPHKDFDLRINLTEMQGPLLGDLFLKYPSNNSFHILGVYCN